MATKRYDLLDMMIDEIRNLNHTDTAMPTPSTTESVRTLLDSPIRRAMLRDLRAQGITSTQTLSTADAEMVDALLAATAGVIEALEIGLAEIRAVSPGSQDIPLLHAQVMQRMATDAVDAKFNIGVQVFNTICQEVFIKKTFTISGDPS